VRNRRGVTTRRSRCAPVLRSGDDCRRRQWENNHWTPSPPGSNTCEHKSDVNRTQNRTLPKAPKRSEARTKLRFLTDRDVRFSFFFFAKSSARLIGGQLGSLAKQDRFVAPRSPHAQHPKVAAFVAPTHSSQGSCAAKWCSRSTLTPALSQRARE
jgi:hypothetical protein